MRWPQIAFSVIIATSVSYFSYIQGFGVVGVTSAALVSYSVTRWGIVWIFRTRFWYHTNSNRTSRCKNCDQYMYRLSGDFVPECKTCGAKQGLPIIRILTRSVAAVQLKRTVYGPLLVIAVISGLALSGALVGAINDPDAEETVDLITSIDSSSISEAGDIENNENEFDQEIARQYLVEELNKERQERGLAPLDASPDLQKAAYEHSQDMVARNFFAHTNPDGLGPHERISQTTISCKSTGENIAQNHWDKNVAGSDRIESNKDLAEVIIKQWIESPPHRENLFRSGWEYVGHGISFDGDKIYITQNFCSR